MNKLQLILLYVLIALGLGYTDSLYQNNDEKLLVPTSSKLETNEDVMVFYFSVGKDRQAAIEDSLKPFNLEYDIVSPYTLSGKKGISDVRSFFNTYDRLDIKLLNKENEAYLVKFKDVSKRDFPKILDHMRSYFKKISVPIAMAGLPYLNKEIGETTKDIKTKILPTLILLTFFLLLYLTKSLAVTAMLFVYPLLNIPLALVLMKLIYGESNLLSTMSPLVSFVIIFCLIIHLFYSSLTFKDYQQLKSHKMKPILFMLFTTFLGILSLYISTVPAVKSFSLISVIGLILSSVFTLLSYRLTHEKIVKADIRPLLFNLRPPRLGKGHVVILLLIPFVSFYFLKNDLRLQVEALHFFPEKSPIYQETKYVENEFVGTPILGVKISRFDLFENYSQAQDMALIEEQVAKIFSDDSIAISNIQSIKNANYIYTQQKVLPDNKFAALTLFARVPLKQDSEDGYQFQILSHSLDTDIYLEKVREVEELLIARGLSYQLYGNYYSLMSSQAEIIETLLESFLLSLLFISFFVGLYLKNIKDFFSFLIINIAPPLCTLSFFVIFDLSLNLATIMTFSISFGLIVDSTLHVIYGDILKLTVEEKSRSIFIPICVSSLVLMLGFMTFTIHNFLPIWQFGLSLSMTILFGYLYDFFVLPSMERG
ncbi:hypothetical protein [Bacteriovorax sp. DB6_IX]|uniref:hypothetical protein n=1 Tax=Bacteriovorax sp. DB6_IX TaxID=1353530 RepID=UPI000389DDF0|nr:hypothetical protein [Bacteriovorax sp. DB6_IX]EQC49714.1 hypothetical protein M901_2773 [Bacteriovorax sp. DB6_IX]